jgi:hypothetical protein
LGLAVECPTCAHTSVNVVSREHVDVRSTTTDAWASSSTSSCATAAALAAFRDELFSGAFDAGRRDLAA